MVLPNMNTINKTKPSSMVIALPHMKIFHKYNPIISFLNKALMFFYWYINTSHVYYKKMRR